MFAKLFVAGLSFYTSEKTLRTAFGGFGELVEGKVVNLFIHHLTGTKLLIL